MFDAKILTLFSISPGKEFNQLMYIEIYRKLSCKFDLSHILLNYVQ